MAKWNRSTELTPWGVADSVEEVAPGIKWYETPSHGGIGLDRERTRLFQTRFAGVRPFAGESWFEEDCDWSLVVLCWPEHFDRRTIAAAVRMARCFGTRKWASVAAFLESDASRFVRSVEAEEVEEETQLETA